MNVCLVFASILGFVGLVVQQFLFSFLQSGLSHS